MIIMVSTSVTYSAYSMNQVTEMAEVIESKQVRDYEQTTEEFDIVKITNDNNQFNMTLKNTGNLPIHLTRLWVENATDPTWPIAKYDLDIDIASGNTTQNIGQNIGLTALDTQSYIVDVVTERGNSEKIFLNSVGEESLYLNLRATPNTVPTGFTTTLVLEVVNTGTTKLLNLQAVMPSAPISNCTTSCSATYVSGPYPASFDSLDPGDIANFEWVYTIDGETSGDTQTFTANLVNGIDTASAVVTTQTIDTAENANVALESGGVSDDQKITDDILIFHMEQTGVPPPGYQMMSSDVDGGSSGLKLHMDSYLAANPVSFITNNGTNSITIPSGDWTASLALRSEPLPISVQDQTAHMIFHFEDGAGINPDNSQGDSDRDLDGCSATTFQSHILLADNDAEENPVGSVDLGDQPSYDHELVYDTSSFTGFQHIGLRWQVDIPSGAQIQSANIQFRASESQTGNSPNIVIGAEKTNDPAIFVDATNNISDRWADVTTAKVVWNAIPAWSDGAQNDATTTPDLSAIVQEIVDDGNWDSNEHMVFILQDNSGGGNTNRRTAEHFDGGTYPGGSPATWSARLTIVYGVDGVPDWKSNEGPHGSGAFKYDGNTMCHQSQNDVSSSDGNHLGTTDTSTSLWFRVDTSTAITDEQMLVFWKGPAYPADDYYKISIGSDATDRGKILFEYDENGSQAKEVSCLSENEYDDGNWYHIVATRDASADDCQLYITDIFGANPEPVVEATNNHNGDLIVSGKWYVASAGGTSNFFKGWIDDIMHYNSVVLDSTEANDLSHTNYGTTAHELDILINVVDSDGNFVSSIYDGPGTGIGFQDPTSYSDSSDRGYAMFNVTMNSLPQVSLLPLQKLNFSMNFVPSTTIWEALELDMAIDDSNFSNPYPSYIQLPLPSNPFPSYVTYDNDDAFVGYVDNIGLDGVYFVYPGTRLTFSGENGAYAAYIDYVNATNPSSPEPYQVTDSRDSIYIPSGDTAEVTFYSNPTDHPCQDVGGSCSAANIIPAGDYSVAIWVNGYSDQGETFGRSVVFGTITVVD